MSKEMKVQWVRKINSRIVFTATEKRLEDGKFFPCDINGNFLSTGQSTAPVVEPEQTAPPVKKESDAETEDQAMLAALIERAKELKIKNPHTMKEETLVARIEQAEMDLEKGPEE